MSRKSLLKVGTVLTVEVKKEHIDDSDPCDKDNCMLSRAVWAHLADVYGEQKFKIKSTNHGVVFDLHGRRYTCVFDTKTGNTIYSYDEIFKIYRSKSRARASVRPFKARLIVEAGCARPVYAPMSKETKAALAKHHRDQRRAAPDAIHEPKRGGRRRELSL